MNTRILLPCLLGLALGEEAPGVVAGGGAGRPVQPLALGQVVLDPGREGVALAQPPGPFQIVPQGVPQRPTVARPTPLEGEAQERVKMLDPQALQSQYLAALRQLLRALAQRRPLVVILDDIHWADPSSSDLLMNLLPLTAEAPLLNSPETLKMFNDGKAAVGYICWTQNVEGLARLRGQQRVALLDEPAQERIGGRRPGPLPGGPLERPREGLLVPRRLEAAAPPRLVEGEVAGGAEGEAEEGVGAAVRPDPRGELPGAHQRL